MNRILFLVLFVLALTAVSCGRKGKPEELTPGNAGEKYGEVMSRTMQRAKDVDIVLSLHQAVQAFRAVKGRYPESLQELVDEQFIAAIPPAPQGKRIVYDGATGTVRVE